MKVVNGHVEYDNQEEFVAYQAVKSIPGEATQTHRYLLHDFADFVSLLSITRNKLNCILDAGCREGWLCSQFRFVTGAECVGRVVDYAQKQGRKVYIWDIDYEIDAFEHPLGAHVFDGVFMSHVLEHVKFPGQTLSNMCRHLKAGGLIYITVPDIQKPVDEQLCHSWSFNSLNDLIPFVPSCCDIYRFEKRNFRGQELVLILQKKIE